MARNDTCMYETWRWHPHKLDCVIKSHAWVMSNMNGLCHSWMRRVEYTMSQAPVFSVWIKWHASPESLIGYFQLEWTKGWTSKTNWDESPCPFCHGGDSRSDLDKIRRSSDMRAHQESFKRKNVAVFVHLDIFRKTECIPYLWTYIFIFTCFSFAFAFW